MFVLFQKPRLGAGETLQSVKHLPYKQEDLNANPDSDVKRPGKMACICNLSTGEVETDSRLLRLDGQLV